MKAYETARSLECRISYGPHFRARGAYSPSPVSPRHHVYSVTLRCSFICGADKSLSIRMSFVHSGSGPASIASRSPVACWVSGSLCGPLSRSLCRRQITGHGSPTIVPDFDCDMPCGMLDGSLPDDPIQSLICTFGQVGSFCYINLSSPPCSPTSTPSITRVQKIYRLHHVG